MLTLHCDHRMNLPCDTVTMLMVITCALIYMQLAIYRIRTHKLLQPSTRIFYVIQYLAPFIKMYCIHIQWLVLVDMFIQM